MIFGFLSGLIGYFFASQNNDYLPFWGQVDISEIGYDQTININQPRTVIAKQDILLDKIENDVASILVSFYPFKGSILPLSAAYADQDMISQGVAITNDGWVVAGRSLNENGGPYLTVGYQSKSYAVSKIVRDDASGAVFGKIDGKNLPVAEMGDSDALKPGQTLAIFSRLGGLTPAQIKKIGYHFKNRSDLIQSSEKLNKRIMVNRELSVLDEGAAVFNLNGEVVGLVSGGSIVPSNYFKELFGQILQNQKIKRPFAGLKYFDLAHTDGLDKWGDRGALIAALPANSGPLAGRLLENDVILKINGEEINKERSLSEALNRYRPNDEVIMELSRQGQTKEIIFRLR